MASFSSFPSDHKAFVTQVCTLKEPAAEAASQPEWVDAMNKEVEALIKNNTWTMAP